MWQPDGWDVRTRIGVLTPHADVGPESEIRAMAPESVGVHAARVPFGAMAAGGVMDPTIPLAPVAAFVEPPHIDDAVSLLAAAPVAVIGIGFTSSAYVTGADAERELIDRLQRRSSGIPVVATCAAAVDALRVLGATGLPSSIPRGSTMSSTDWVRSTSHRRASRWSRMPPVISRATSGASTHLSSLSGSSRIHPAVPRRCSWVATAFGASASSLRLRKKLARPVLTANQVLLWGMLRAVRSRISLPGYGQLFTMMG